MFKSTFAKYLVAFLSIIFISFMLFSSIITAMMGEYAKSDTEYELRKTAQALVNNIEDKNAENIENAAYIEYYANILIDLNPEIEFFVCNSSGKIILSTLTESGSIAVSGDLGNLDVNSELFDEHTDAENEIYLKYTGNIVELNLQDITMYGKEIVTQNTVRGYVFALTDNSDENGMILFTRQIIINVSVWVMLSAMIAVYFITERIIHPLRSMTAAVNDYGAGKFETRVAIVGDDEIARLGRAFNDMAQALENLDKMRNSFLASVSHDLRTPMTTISGFIDGITSGAIPQEKHEYYLGIISTEVHRLSRLVTQLLDISRYESGDRKLNQTDFDVTEVARLILISFEKQIEEKNLDVSFETSEDAMRVFADKDAIYQVIYNLCHNAIKFSKQNGKYAIKIKYISPTKAEFSVYNEGVGIAKEDLEFVFDRFYKSDKSRGLDKTGTGLGLYISRTIVEAHGEKIYVKSTENVDCEFGFTLKTSDPSLVGAKMKSKK